MRATRWKFGEPELCKAVLTYEPQTAARIAKLAGLSVGKAADVLCWMVDRGTIGISILGRWPDIRATRRAAVYYLRRAVRGEALDSWLCWCWLRNPTCCLVCRRCVRVCGRGEPST
ncbi:MAG TPA: hypothetical protein VK752_05125 [Bryobacteraceae bacterium]|nr:hypothetical protein [Bryobacteraceae bacterium]